MAAYVIFDRGEVTDPEKMEKYRSQVTAVVERFGGRYLAAGGNAANLEGKWSPRFLVVIEFPSREQASRWHDSEEYRELKALRQAAAKGNMILVDGT